jgi:soluble lytic murein transglycosylase
MAASEYLGVWRRFPSTDAARIATLALDDLDARLAEPTRGAGEYRRRGDAFFRKRQNENALGAYERALELGGMSPAERRRAQRQRAHTLFRMRRYPEATAAYAALPQNDELRIEMARARARAGDVPRAIEELQKLGRGRGRHAARANLLAGLLAEGEGEHDQARKLFLEVAQRGSGGLAAGAVWRLGWSMYLEGRFSQAIDYFDQLTTDEPTLSGLRARYWRARARERLGRAGTQAEYQAIARDFPLSYYGIRAAGRGGTTLPATPQRIAPGTTELTTQDLARPRILLTAGMRDEALMELHRLAPRVEGLSDRLAVAQLYAESGDFNRPQRLMVAAYQNRLAKIPALDDLEVWWHAWPAPYREPFREVARGGVQVEPGLVYAVMREESGYRPEVVSVSGARGLLQIMPETGERLARTQALSGFSPDDLFVPSINIQLGSFYLEQLMQRFEGRTSAAVASYNAGPLAVSSWLQNGPEADDEWVEAIPYDQTRRYVKRVLRSLHVYRVLY